MNDCWSGSVRAIAGSTVKGFRSGCLQDPMLLNKAIRLRVKRFRLSAFKVLLALSQGPSA